MVFLDTTKHAYNERGRIRQSSFGQVVPPNSPWKPSALCRDSPRGIESDARQARLRLSHMPRSCVFTGLTQSGSHSSRAGIPPRHRQLPRKSGPKGPSMSELHKFQHHALSSYALTCALLKYVRCLFRKRPHGRRLGEASSLP